MKKRHMALWFLAKQFKDDPEVGRWTSGDTVVHVWQDADGYWLIVETHGHDIMEAVRTPDGSINVKLRTRGWATMLTANVLNAVLKGMDITDHVNKRGDSLVFRDQRLPEDSWLLI